MQYNISNRQTLFWCFALIILRMTNGKLRCFTLMFSMPDFILSLVFFFYQNQGFYSHKIALLKKRVYIHNGKRILFSEFFSIRKSIPPILWVERKRFHFVHQKIISFWTGYCTIKNRSTNPLNSKIELFMTTVSPGSASGFY